MYQVAFDSVLSEAFLSASTELSYSSMHKLLSSISELPDLDYSRTLGVMITLLLK